MVVLEESPWYQEILSKGEQKGRVQMFLRMLQQRFGAVSPDVMERLAVLEIQTLVSLADAVITVASLEDFLRAMAQHTAPEQLDDA